MATECTNRIGFECGEDHGPCGENDRICEECYQRDVAGAYRCCDTCGGNFALEALTPCFTEANELDHYLCHACCGGGHI